MLFLVRQVQRYPNIYVYPFHVIYKSADIKTFLSKLQVGSFDAGYGSSIMSRLVSLQDGLDSSRIQIVYIKGFIYLFDSFLFGIGWTKKGKGNVVHDKILHS